MNSVEGRSAARILDGKAAATAIKAELTERVAALAARGVRAGRLVRRRPGPAPGHGVVGLDRRRVLRLGAAPSVAAGGVVGALTAGVLLLLVALAVGGAVVLLLLVLLRRRAVAAGRLRGERGRGGGGGAGGGGAGERRLRIQLCQSYALPRANEATVGQIERSIRVGQSVGQSFRSDERTDAAVERTRSRFTVELSILQRRRRFQNSAPASVPLLM